MVGLVAIVGLALLGYVLGSMPWSVWIGRGLYGVDVREYGSGNAGATNTIRVLGLGPGLLVFLLDMLKGYFSVATARWVSRVLVSGGVSHGKWAVPLMLVAGVGAFLGHVFPLFARFRGGKGVATLCGVVLGLHLFAALSALCVFAVVLLLTHYVSLGSMLAAVSFPLFLYAYGERDLWLLLISALLALLVVVTHRANIGRLIRGTESHFSPSRKGMREREVESPAR